MSALAEATDRRDTQQPWTDSLVDGKVLKQAGFKPGPQFKDILTRAREAQIQGDITCEAEAIAWAKAQLP